MAERGRVLVTGSAGFIGGYVVEELLGRGYAVVGLDDHSKYGRVNKSYDDHPDYTFHEGDARDTALMTELLRDCDHLVAAAEQLLDDVPTDEPGRPGDEHPPALGHHMPPGGVARLNASAVSAGPNA